MKMSFEIKSRIEPGFLIVRDGQEYEFKGDIAEPKTLENGRRLNRKWSSKCKTCGEPFDFDSDMDITYMTRRCAPCRPWNKK